MGSRYGGLKQIDPVGPSGETMLDYAVYDAIRAGFGRVVFLIRVEFEDAFRNTVAAKYAGRIAVDFVFQSVVDVPEGCRPPLARERPWLRQMLAPPRSPWRLTPWIRCSLRP